MLAQTNGQFSSINAITECYVKLVESWISVAMTDNWIRFNISRKWTAIVTHSREEQSRKLPLSALTNFWFALLLTLNRYFETKDDPHEIHVTSSGLFPFAYSTNAHEAFAVHFLGVADDIHPSINWITGKFHLKHHPQAKPPEHQKTIPNLRLGCSVTLSNWRSEFLRKLSFRIKSVFSCGWSQTRGSLSQMSKREDSQKYTRTHIEHNQRNTE